jgi:hypothetical protein
MGVVVVSCNFHMHSVTMHPQVPKIMHAHAAISDTKPPHAHESAITDCNDGLSDDPPQLKRPEGLAGGSVHPTGKLI